MTQHEFETFGRSFVLVLNDMHAVQLELSQELLALAERHARCADAIETLADRVYALTETEDV